MVSIKQRHIHECKFHTCFEVLIGSVTALTVLSVCSQLHFHVKVLHNWYIFRVETCTYDCNNVFFSRLVTALHSKSESISFFGFYADDFIRTCRWTVSSLFNV